MKQKKKPKYWDVYRMFRFRYPNVPASMIREAAKKQVRGIGRPSMSLNWAQARYYRDEFGISLSRARYYAKYRARGYMPMSSTTTGRFHYVFNFELKHKKTGEIENRIITIARDKEVSLKKAKQAALDLWEELGRRTGSKNYDIISITLLNRRMSAPELFHPEK